MQRSEYQKNTGGHGISDEILGYFYDNIQHTEFIAHDADEEDTAKRSKSASRKARKVKARLAANEAAKNGKLDPYDIIIDDKLKLDILRPSLKEELNFENTYSYLGTATSLDFPSLRSAFLNFGILQVVSARSRPEAFISPSTTNNPHDTHVGVVDIKVAKVGMLWRKEAKKRKTRSPWQEWGAILTPSQLFFFRNTSWVKSLSHQAETYHHRANQRRSPVIFRPPLEEFRFDAKVNTADAIAISDSGYRRHKHGFVLARKGNVVDDSPHDSYFEEVLLADNEGEMNDWIAKLNYAAAFRSANVKMHSWCDDSKQRRANAGVSQSEPNIPAKLQQNGPQSNGRPLGLQSNQLFRHETPTRVDTTLRKVTVTEDEILSCSRRLDEHMRVARHLQILAPFPPRTRSELLAYGARMAHNIRWSRYELARLKCQRDILLRDLKQDGEQTKDNGPASQQITSKINALSTKDESNLSEVAHNNTIPSSERADMTPGATSAFRNSIHSSDSSRRDTDLIEGIDEAFATPPETLSRFASSDETQFKLLPLSLNLHTSNLEPSNPYFPSNRRDQADDRRLSSISRSSRRASLDKPLSGSSTPTPSMRDGDRPSTATESDMEGVQAISSPNHRSKARRSLQRTLREPRDGTHRQHSRNKKGKDTASTLSTDDSSSVQDGEGLSRKPASFTVHGKKASVIRLGSEWHQISAEERLRSRKLAQSDEQRLSGVNDPKWDSDNRDST